MGSYTHSDDELDPELLLVAAHELGHATVDIAYGVTVLSIEVDRRAYTGLTQVDFDERTCTPTQFRGAVIASLAGFEAERLWCRRHGGTPSRHCSRTDFANFHRNCRQIGLTTNVARANARTTLKRHWARLERLTPQLARHGHIQPW